MKSSPNGKALEILLNKCIGDSTNRELTTRTKLARDISSLRICQGLLIQASVNYYSCDTVNFICEPFSPHMKYSRTHFTDAAHVCVYPCCQCLLLICECVPARLWALLCAELMQREERCFIWWWTAWEVIPLFPTLRLAASVKNINSWCLILLVAEPQHSLLALWHSLLALWHSDKINARMCP